MHTMTFMFDGEQAAGAAGLQAVPIGYAAPEAIGYAAPEAIGYAAPEAIGYAAPQAIGGVRITCAMLPLRKLPLFHKLEEQARAAARDVAGVGEKEPLPPDALGVLSLLLCWVRGLATTVKLETCAPGKGADAGDWQDSSPAILGWDTAAGVLDLPAALLSAWDRVAVASNPGLWERDGAALPAKKVGTISVV